MCSFNHFFRGTKFPLAMSESRSGSWDHAVCRKSTRAAANANSVGQGLKRGSRGLKQTLLSNVRQAVSLAAVGRAHICCATTTGGFAAAAHLKNLAGIHCAKAVGGEVAKDAG